MTSSGGCTVPSVGHSVEDHHVVMWSGMSGGGGGEKVSYSPLHDDADGRQVSTPLRVHEIEFVPHGQACDMGAQICPWLAQVPSWL